MVNFNKIIKAKERDINQEYQERLKRCRPIAQKIIEMIAEAKLPMGDLKDKNGNLKEDIESRYYDFTGEVLKMMLESGMKYSERNHVFQLMLQTYEQTMEKTTKAIELSFERAFKEKWKDELDITMGDIHEILLKISKQ